MSGFGWMGLLRGVVGVGAVLLGLQQSGTDPRVGSWTLVSAQATLDPANKLTIVSAKEGVHVVMTGEVRLDFTAKADGRDAPVPKNPGFDQVAVKRINKKQVEVTEKKNGSVVAVLRDKLSADGMELTLVRSSTGQADVTTVWTRSGGVKNAGDPLAGEWTQDMSRTRLRQGMVVKFVGDGQDGVRFAGEYSYTARFDGKAYDVKNSRNDTVTLARVDAHTVDAVYRRDNQVTQRDRWVVAGDGQQMTVTSTATLETGQKLAETLGFKRQ